MNNGIKQSPGYIVFRPDGLLIDKSNKVIIFADRESALKSSGEDGKILPVTWDSQNTTKDKILVDMGSISFLLGQDEIKKLISLYFAYHDLIDIENEVGIKGITPRRAQMKAKARAILIECRKMLNSLIR